jgi:hypothetical protein
MSRMPSNFRESDLKKAVKAIEAAGRKVAAVEIEDGRIIRIKLKIGNGADDDNTEDNTEAAEDLRKLI